MKAIIITTKDGEKIELGPVVEIIIDNSYHEYKFDGDDIENIEVIHA